MRTTPVFSEGPVAFVSSGLTAGFPPLARIAVPSVALLLATAGFLLLPDITIPITFWVMVLAAYWALPRFGRDYADSIQEPERQRRDERPPDQAPSADRRLIAAYPDPTLITDCDGTVRDANPAAEQLFGLSWRSLVGMDLSEIFTEPALGRVTFRQVLRSGIQRDRPFFVQRAGNLVPVLLTASTYRDETGSILGVVAVVREIIEEKGEEMLELHRLLVENLNEGIIMVDPDGQITYVNPSMAAMLGYPADRIVGRPFAAFADEADAGKVTDIIERRKKGAREQYEFAFRRRDASRMDVLVSAQPIFDSEGKYRASIAAVLDITGRKRAEGELRRSEERFRIALRDSPTTVFTVDEDLRYTWIHNPPFDLPAEAVVGKTDAEIFGLDEAKCLMNLKRHVLETGSGVREVVQARFGDSVYTFDIAVEPLQDTSGTVVGIKGAAHDITGLKRTEERLKATNDLLEAIFDNLGDIVGILQPDQTVVRYNRIGYELLGTNPDEVVGKKCYEVIGHVAPCAICATQKVLETAKPAVVEKYVPELGRHMECRSSPVLDEVGRVTLVVEQLLDISDRVLAEQALRKSEEKYRTLFETMEEGVVYQDADGAIVDANPAAERILGLSLDQMRGVTSMDERWRAIREDGTALPGEEHPAMVALKAGEPAREVMGVYHPVEERYRWIIVNAIPLFMDGEERPHRVYTSFEDITERKHAEEAIRESEERYRSFVQNFQGIAFRGTPDLRPILLHGAVEEITGYTEEEIVRGVRRWELLIHPEDRDAIAESTRTLTTAPCRSIEREYRIIRKDGDVRWLRELSRNVCDASGRPLCIEGAFYDVTGRKRAEESLRRAEEEKALILNTTAEMFAYYDTNLRVLWANRAAAESVGLKPEDLVGRFCYEIWQNRAGPCEGCPVSRARDTGRPQEAEVTTPDGRVYFLRGYPVTDDAGDVVGLIEFGLEITERKRAEQELRIKDMAMAASLNAISLIDLELRMFYVNQAVLDLWGYGRPEEILGEPISTLWADPEALDLVGSALLREGRWAGELQARRRDGTIFLTQVSVTNVTAEDGTSLCYIGHAIDITEQKRIEQALRQSEEKYREITQRSFDMIYTCYHDGGIQYMSPAVERILGYTPEELIGEQCGDYVLESSRQNWLDARQHIVRGEAVGGVQIEFRRKDGTVAVVELNESPIMKDGRVVGVQAVGRDITERKRLEQVRMEAYRQIERNIEQFAVLGDHIRQPLQVIMGLAEVIEGDRTEKIVEQVNRINSIIRQLDQGWVESRKVREFLKRYEE